MKKEYSRVFTKFCGIITEIMTFATSVAADNVSTCVLDSSSTRKLFEEEK